jgi:hypothetical protein
LLRALEPRQPHLDYYAHGHRREDTDYLRDLVDTCRTALEALPSFLAIADSVRCVTARIVAYQSLNHGDASGSYDAFTRWARAQTGHGSGLRWWEMGAAAGSPLPVFALMAAAARPSTQAKNAAALERAYFPWIASLSSLLDSLIDRHEDVAEGQRSLIDYYGSSAEVASRLQGLATQAVDHTRSLSDGSQHMMILAAMASFYRATPQASAPDIRLVTQRVFDAMEGDFSGSTSFVLHARRMVAGVGGTLTGVYGTVRAVARHRRHLLVAFRASDAAMRHADTAMRHADAAMRHADIAIRHANSGIGAFADRWLLTGSSRAAGGDRDSSRISSLGEMALHPAPVSRPIQRR